MHLKDQEVVDLLAEHTRQKMTNSISPAHLQMAFSLLPRQVPKLRLPQRRVGQLVFHPDSLQMDFLV